MAKLELVRSVALTLPRSYEAVVRDRVKFRVGRIVYLAFSRDEETMGFAFPKEERADLIAAEPEKFFMPRVSDQRYNWVELWTPRSTTSRCARSSSKRGGWSSRSALRPSIWASEAALACGVHAHPPRVRSALHAAAARLGGVGRGRLRPRRRSPGTTSTSRRSSSPTRRSRSCSSTSRAWRPRPRSSRARATTTSTGATSSASAPPAGSTPRARPACTSTGSRLETDDVLVTVCPWWDGPLTARGRRTASSPRTPRSSATGPGSGCTTHRPTTRRRAGPASATTATRTSAPGSSSTTRDRAVRPRAPVAVHARRQLDRPDRLDAGAQRRPPARPGPDAHRDRHRRRARPVAVVRRRRRAGPRDVDLSRSSTRRF